MKNVIACMGALFCLVSGAEARPKESSGDADLVGKMIIRIADIEVVPEYFDEYISFAKTVGETSVREEKGVIAIFPMIVKRDTNKVRILEIYASEEAYKSHIATEHFKTYKEGTLHMVKSLDLVDMNAMNPDGLRSVFRKMDALKARKK